MNADFRSHTRMPTSQWLTPVPGGLLQRKCACGNQTLGGGECAECQKKRQSLQRKEMGTGASLEVPSIVHDVLGSPGKPLDASARAMFEPRFGQDFSRVRVHTDAKAAESAQQVDALAYTVGKNVVFGNGQYVPGTSSGTHLLAHELAHVLQQSNAETPTDGLRIGPASDRHEHAADRAADQVAAGGAAPRIEPATPALQREPAPDSLRTEPDPASREASREASITLDGFAFGKSDLTEGHKKQLVKEAAAIISLLAHYPDSFGSVVGFTDAVGSENDNRLLGQQRADAVLAELLANGVPKDLLRKGSLGKTALAVNTQQPEPRNRRVEIFFTARRFSPSRIAPIQPGIPSLSPTPNLQPGSPSPILPGISPLKPSPVLPKIAATKDPLDKLSEGIHDRLPDFTKKLVSPDDIKTAMKRGGEKAVLELLDKLIKVDGPTKGALLGAISAAIRQFILGEKWTPPTPPLYEPPPSNAPSMPKSPGEFILPLPPFKF